ncbi:MAG: hypothetical protein ACLR2O_05415 [Coprococcus sp.]
MEKTEIAIRAAFKAVQENKQVVYLVPTTILAHSSITTLFVQRMKESSGKGVDLLCRTPHTCATEKNDRRRFEKGSRLISSTEPTGY